MSQSKPRVFITQESPNLNYGPAEQFGEVVFLTARDLSPIPGSLANAELCQEVSDRLRDFDFDHDFLVPSGSPSVCGLAFLELGKEIEHRSNIGSREPKHLRILRWSNRDRVYQPITINLQ